MAVVPDDERKAIITEATNNTLRELQMKAKTIDQLDVADKVEPTDKVELSGNQAATISQIAETIQDAAAPEWEDF